MKKKPLDRGSRRLWFVSKLRQTLLLRNRSAPVCGVVEVWASKGRHNPEEEAEGTARTLSSSKSFCSGDLCGGGGGSV